MNLLRVRFWGVIVALILVSLTPSLVLGQSSATGALTGTITDPTGASVPNAKVTVTSVDTAQSRTATSESSGIYRVLLLPPGVYQVKFEASGFKTVELPSVTIAVTEIATLNQALTVGAQVQEVTVHEEAEAIQTENAALGSVVATKTITDLPLSTRNYTFLLSLSAGANSSVIDATQLGKGLPNSAVNGAGAGSNNFQMDGAPIGNYSGPGTLNESGTFGGIGIPNPDALQEFKIQTSAYDAGSGRNAGAIMNVVTRSGGNDFHGTAFEFLRNTSLNANGFFFNLAGKPRGRFDQNQYGGSFGGPVKRNKFFFFTSFQETSQKNGITGYGSGIVTLPPLGNDATTDRGSCPLTATTVAGCNAAAINFATNIVGPNICFHQTLTNNNQLGPNTRGGEQLACNGSNINVTAMRLLELKKSNGSYLIPSSFGLPGPDSVGYAQTVFSDPARYKEHQGVGNIDYLINTKNTLAGRYFYATDPTTANFLLGPNNGPGSSLPGSPFTFKFTNDESVLKLTTILSSNLVNEARVSYQRNVAIGQNEAPYTNAQVGVQPINNSFPIISDYVIGSIYQFGPYTFGDNVEITNSYGAADTLSWTHGKQTIRTGFESQHDAWYWNFIGLQIGSPTFASFPDFLLGLPGCAPALTQPQCTASMGNGPGATNGTFFSNVNSIGGAALRASSSGLVHNWRSTAYDSFVEDDIKLTPRFTLNLGLRWEFDGNISDTHGGYSDIWQSLLKTQPVPGTGCVYNGVSYGLGASGTGCSFAGFVVPKNYNVSFLGVTPPPGVFHNDSNTPTQISTPKDNFAPRLGFAWQPLSSNKLAVRGGFGYFYDRISGGAFIGSVEQNPPVSVTLGYSGTTNYFSTLVPQSSGALAQVYAPAATTPLGFTPRWASATKGSSNILATSMADSYITPLLYKYNLEVQYEFKPQWVLEVGYVGSQGIHQTGSIPINVATLIQPGGSIVFPDGVINTNTTQNAALRVPYLGMPAGFSQSGTEGNLKYNSLQVTVRKQLSHGLTFQAAYTFARGFTTNYTDSPYQAVYAPNAGYRPHVVTVSYGYDLPFGNPGGLLGKVATGWNLSGVTVIQDGTPLTITDTGGQAYGVGSTAQFCLGDGPAQLAAPGSLYDKVGPSNPINGLGYFNGGPGNNFKNATCTGGAIFTTIPTVGAFPAGVAPGPVYPASAGSTGFGNAGQGIILGPGQQNWDMALQKVTKVGGLHEGATLVFRAEFFNLFNHPQFSNPSTNVGAGASFGKISTTTVNPRLMQFALKYVF